MTKCQFQNGQSILHQQGRGVLLHHTSKAHEWAMAEPRSRDEAFWDQLLEELLQDHEIRHTLKVLHIPEILAFRFLSEK